MLERIRGVLEYNRNNTLWLQYEVEMHGLLEDRIRWKVHNSLQAIA